MTTLYPTHVAGNGRHEAPVERIMAEATAPCPICNKLVPLESINGHIDVCLLPEGERAERSTEPAASKSSKENTTASTSHASSSLFKVSSISRPQHVQSTLRKRSSLSPSATETNSRQSSLQFGQSAPRQSSEYRSSPPPVKARKLTAGLVSPSQTFTTASPAIYNANSSGIADDRSETSTSLETEKKANPVTELNVPLAEVMRPSSIENYVGQESVIGKNAILRTILESGTVPSLIFWGPPGCGKVNCV